jgi:hypothetical protein
MKNQEAQTKVDFTSQIEEVVFNYGIQESDGTITPASSKTLEGIISVWEQRILYKRNPITGSIMCTVTDSEDLIDYNVEFTEKGINHEGMGYRVLCTKKSNPKHWIDLYLCKGYMKPGQAFVEPYDFSNDPTFEYGDISEAVECWAQDNLWK